MRLYEISTKLPNKHRIATLRKLFNSPISVELAKSEIIPYFHTPMLVDIIKELEKSDKTDIRQDLVDYFDVAYPTFTEPFHHNLPKDDEGRLSPLGHKDEF